MLAIGVNCGPGKKMKKISSAGLKSVVSRVKWHGDLMSSSAVLEAALKLVKWIEKFSVVIWSQLGGNVKEAKKNSYKANE